jgi:hypothetical protein
MHQASKPSSAAACYGNQVTRFDAQSMVKACVVVGHRRLVAAAQQARTLQLLRCVCCISRQRIACAQQSVLQGTCRHGSKCVQCISRLVVRLQILASQCGMSSMHAAAFDKLFNPCQHVSCLSLCVLCLVCMRLYAGPKHGLQHNRV